MTQLLKKAFDEASKLPPEEQNALAKAVLDQLASEKGWVTAFDSAQEKLGPLADEALAEHRAKRTQPLDPDNL